MTVAADETSTRDLAATPVGSVRALLAALLGFTVITVDVSAVNIALPYLHRDLGGGMAGLQWVVDAYTLMFAALMLSAGAVTDRVGPVRAYGLGVVLFTAASLACAAAPVMPVLIAARVFQGAAAALVMPASLAQVRVAYDDARARAQAIAVWTIGGSAAMALGPVAGGLLSEYAGWRWVFLVNVPIGILIVALLAGLRVRSVRHRAPLDLPGQVLAVLALSALTYAVIEAGHTGWGSGALVAGVTSVAAALAFVVVEHRSVAPVLPLGLLARGRVAIALVSGFGINFGFYGGIFLLGLYYQQVRGWTGAEAGLMFVIPAALTTCATAAGARRRPTPAHRRWPADPGGGDARAAAARHDHAGLAGPRPPGSARDRWRPGDHPRHRRPDRRRRARPGGCRDRCTQHVPADGRRDRGRGVRGPRRRGERDPHAAWDADLPPRRSRRPGADSTGRRERCTETLNLCLRVRSDDTPEGVL